MRRKYKGSVAGLLLQGLRASGEIGRRAGFRCLYPKGCGGSSPPSPTIVMLQDFWDKRTPREYFFLALGSPKELSLKWRRCRRRDRDRRRLRSAYSRKMLHNDHQPWGSLEGHDPGAELETRAPHRRHCDQVRSHHTGANRNARECAARNG